MTEDMFGATDFEILLSHLRLSLYNEGLLEENEEALERLHSWIDKSIPKKPIRFFDGRFNWVLCPTCSVPEKDEKGHILIHPVTKPFPHCEGCGQRLDWRE